MIACGRYWRLIAIDCHWCHLVTIKCDPDCLRIQVWDGTKDEDLDNVLWHDWEKEGAALEEGAAASSSSAEHPRRQAEAVLHALWPSPT